MNLLALIGINFIILKTENWFRENETIQLAVNTASTMGKMQVLLAVSKIIPVVCDMMYYIYMVQSDGGNDFSI